ncbi:MAG: hypothetical protein PHY09_11390 [Desulfuromonadaceae bacterium]|nr:hypothetical protein [Desulfuromonadaceae bacterium]MDD5106728.1 hypothetical protein [Desulfuromonadaceae bacterium]
MIKYLTLVVMALVLGGCMTGNTITSGYTSYDPHAADWRIWYKTGDNISCSIEVSSIVHLENNVVRAWSKCGSEPVEFLDEVDCKEIRYVLREARPAQTGNVRSKDIAEVYNQDADTWQTMSTSELSNAKYDAWCKGKYNVK